jgi:hypothetical protein
MKCLARDMKAENNGAADHLQPVRLPREQRGRMFDAKIFDTFLEDFPKLAAGLLRGGIGAKEANKRRPHA